MSVSVHAQYQSPGTGSPKWNAAIINVMNSTCASPAFSQNVCCEKGLFLGHYKVDTFHTQTEWRTVDVVHYIGNKE